MSGIFPPPGVETYDPKRYSLPEVQAIGRMAAGSPYMVAMVVDGYQVGICTAAKIDHNERYSMSGWYITFIEVAQGYRGKGYGRLLFDETLRRLDADGHRIVWFVHSTKELVEQKEEFGFRLYTGWAMFPRPTPDSELYVAMPVVLSS